MMLTPQILDDLNFSRPSDISSAASLATHNLEFFLR